jgi:hypothetical protein
MADEPNQSAKSTEDNTNSAGNDKPNAAPSIVIPQHTEEKGWHPEEQEHRRQERRYWRFQYGTSTVTLFFSLIAAAGAAAGSYIAYQAFIASTQAVGEAKRQADEAKRQADAAESQIAVAKDTEERQLRAYVFLSNVHIRVADNTNILDVKLDVKNFGNTPAKDYSFWACTTIREQPLVNKLPDIPDYGPISKSLLAPGEKRSIYNPSLCETHSYSPWGGIPVGERQLLQNGQKAIYVFGILNYLDAWSNKRWTRFRLFTNDKFWMNEGKYGDPDEGNDYY